MHQEHDLRSEQDAREVGDEQQHGAEGDVVTIGEQPADLGGADGPETDVTIASDRYSTIFVDAIDGMSRGNYVVRVFDDDGGAQRNSAIGMR
ncbi:MAG: hypothetical protein DHS20C15_13280 [Planctomycetota bacterium]|nr:MAG: hypothetical protein DHS20C15_13280 [Planctomycetota bacterium]